MDTQLSRMDIYLVCPRCGSNITVCASLAAASARAFEYQRAIALHGGLQKLTYAFQEAITDARKLQLGNQKVRGVYIVG